MAKVLQIIDYTAENLLPRFGQNTDGSENVVILQIPAPCDLPQIGVVPFSMSGIAYNANTKSSVIDMQALYADVDTDKRRMMVAFTTLPGSASFTLRMHYFDNYSSAALYVSAGTTTTRMATEDLITAMVAANTPYFGSIPVTNQFWPYAVAEIVVGGASSGTYTGYGRILYVTKAGVV